MSELTPALKHHILQQYLPHSHENSFSALAARYNVKGGRRTVQRWLARWDGTPSSLEHKRGAGRPRLLSAAEVNENIHGPIPERNRSHHAVHYTDLVDPVEKEQGRTSPSERFNATVKRSCVPGTRLRAHAQRTSVRIQMYSDELGRCCVQRADVALRDVPPDCVSVSWSV